MLIEMIQERIQFAEKTDSWQDAIRMTMEPLLKEGFITQQYIDATIESVIKKRTVYHYYSGICDAAYQTRKWCFKNWNGVFKIGKTSCISGWK